MISSSGKMYSVGGDIPEKKGADVPVARKEDGIPSKEGHEETGATGIPGRIGLEQAAVRKRPAVDALGLERAVEADVGRGHDAVVDDLRGRDEGDEPTQHRRRVGADLQEREQRDQQHHDDAVDGHAVLEALGEELGGLALERQPEQRARRAVDAALGSQPGFTEQMALVKRHRVGTY